MKQQAVIQLIRNVMKREQPMKQKAMIQVIKQVMTTKKQRMRINNQALKKTMKQPILKQMAKSILFLIR